MRPCPLSSHGGEGGRELGNRSSSLAHHSLTPYPWSYSCLGDRRRQDKGMPLATRVLINRSLKERRCQDVTLFLLWELPVQLFLALEEKSEESPPPPGLIPISSL